MEILTNLTNKAVRYGFVVACVVIGCAAWPSALNADPIPTLYNTGVNDDYELLDDLAPDPHYKLVVNPDSDLIHPFVVKSDEFPIPPWLANGPDSKWLAVREGENANGINGNYTYRTSFDLTGFDLEMVYIDMGWSVDNTGVNVLLNGKPLRDIDDNPMTIGAAGFGGWAYHTIESDQRFIPGINTLDFLVFNAGTQVNPIGLRVEFDADADPLDADEKPMVRTLFAVQGDNFVDTIPDLWQVIQDEPSVYPETVTVRAGQQVSFMVTASAGDASYEWQRDGNAIAGANGPMLTLSEVETDQSGSYTVKVSNGGGSATSGAVTLTVLPTVELNMGRYARIHVNGIAGRTYRLESTTTAGQAFSGGQEITLPAEGAGSLVEPLAKFSVLFRVKLLP